MQSSLLLGGVGRIAANQAQHLSVFQNMLFGKPINVSFPQSMCDPGSLGRHGHVHGLSAPLSPERSYTVLRAVVTDVRSDGVTGRIGARRQRCRPGWSRTSRARPWNELEACGPGWPRPRLSIRLPSPLTARERALDASRRSCRRRLGRPGSVAAPARGGIERRPRRRTSTSRSPTRRSRCSPKTAIHGRQSPRREEHRQGGATSSGSPAKQTPTLKREAGGEPPVTFSKVGGSRTRRR